ncbi:uncharacterized protein LOC106729103 [Camelus ferus]|uniref:Uncharacterized protein LOC106729103 n=1 Tax=Camelus ferus TaxID=419612 RepID=A0A8B8TP99_CAMFR|nr:uncharacterized protein LOC106729103 [Camelus ferus]
MWQGHASLAPSDWSHEPSLGPLIGEWRCQLAPSTAQGLLGVERGGALVVPPERDAVSAFLRAAESLQVPLWASQLILVQEPLRPSVPVTRAPRSGSPAPGLFRGEGPLRETVGPRSSAACALRAPGSATPRSLGLEKPMFHPSRLRGCLSSRILQFVVPRRSLLIWPHEGATTPEVSSVAYTWDLLYWLHLHLQKWWFSGSHFQY